jgi:hypothetical protein
MNDEQLSLFGSGSVLDVSHAQRYMTGGEASITTKALMDICSLRYGGEWDDDLCNRNSRIIRCWHHPKKMNIYINIHDHAYSLDIYHSTGKGLPIYPRPGVLLSEKQLFQLLDLYVLEMKGDKNEEH